MALTFYHCIHILPYISCFLYIIHRLKRMKTAYICLIHVHVISSCTEQEGLQGDEFSISRRSVAEDSNFTTAWTRHQSGGPQIILQLIGYITDTRTIGHGSQEHSAWLRENTATKTGQGWKTFSAKGQKVNILGIESLWQRLTSPVLWWQQPGVICRQTGEAVFQQLLFYKMGGRLLSLRAIGSQLPRRFCSVAEEDWKPKMLKGKPGAYIEWKS